MLPQGKRSHSYTFYSLINFLAERKPEEGGATYPRIIRRGRSEIIRDNTQEIIQIESVENTGCRLKR